MNRNLRHRDSFDAPRPANAKSALSSGRAAKRNWWGRACAVLVLWAITAIALPAQSFTTLYRFNNVLEGIQPVAALVQATDGNLYGTACCGDGGSIFKITPSGTLTTLYTFCAQSGCTDGEVPEGPLVQASDGNLYGTTIFGGANGIGCSPACGTIFRITPSGTLTTLYSFCSQTGCTDGGTPPWGVIQASDGNLYGTTQAGGANGYGTFFTITPGGTLTTLYSFCSLAGCTDGGYPSRLVQATDGDFYGTDSGGLYGYGTMFKITSGGTLTTLYNFCSQVDCADGSSPNAGVIQASDGNFYGTTYGGGANYLGTVFKITPAGTLKTLYSFCPESGCTDGRYPEGALVQATDGNFYGTAVDGGANGTVCNAGCGTVFRITPSGRFTTIYSFCSQGGFCGGGDFPYAALVQATNGSFYGSTLFGGVSACVRPYGCGTLFSLSVGLGPFVETQPTSGRAGMGVRVLGFNLTGATSVTFNGTPAVFHVLSPSLITATVPLGATSGTVKVVTPSLTLSSNVPFRVRP